jgi:hypothetical protein
MIFFESEKSVAMGTALVASGKNYCVKIGW